MNTQLKNDKLFTNLEDLKGWDKNPRSISKDGYQRLKKQIQKLGQYKPLLVTTEGIVLGGNMRLKVYNELKIKEVWISIIDPKNEDEMMEYTLSDNDRAGYYNSDMLANMMPEFSINLEDYAVDLSEPILLQSLNNLGEEEIQEDNFNVPDEVKTDIKKGDLFEIGEHRLLCGDSTKQEDVAILMNGKKANMVFTDPPYGVDYSSRVDKDKRKPWGGIINDDLKGENLKEFLYDSCFSLEHPKYICCNWQSVVDFILALGKPNAFIVWDKMSIGLGAGYRNQHEIILFYGKLDTNSESNVWSIKRDSTSHYEHPTQKPLAISSRAIKNSSKAGNIVLDIFLGSGSTMVACEQLDRVCYGMELDPKYCQVIVDRMLKLKPNITILKNGKPYENS